MAFLSPFLTFPAFCLLLLVSLSTPIINSFFLFRLSLLKTASVNFGVWGYCISPITVSVLGISRTSHAKCSNIHLGYTFDSTVAAALHATDIESIISRTTTAALVLHPIAAGLAFLTFLTSLFILRRRSNATSKISSLMTFGVGLLAAGITTLVFLIDVILVAVVRKGVYDASRGDLNLTWGNAVWMSLAAAVALWISAISLCTCNRFNKRKVVTF